MHENLIARVMNMLLSGQDEILGILREQYKNCKVIFILYIKNGAITMLEGYTNIIDIWPDDNTISLCFDSRCYRNYDALRNKWRCRNKY